VKRSLAVLAALAAVAAAVAASAVGAGQDRTFTDVSVSQIMVGWDPATAYSNEIVAMSNMYETLTRYNAATKKAEPLLAQSFRSSNGGKTWTFQLRRGITFHTGRPLTAAAAKAAIMRTIDLKQGASYIWDAVKSIATPSKYTLVFHLKYPAPLDLNASADYAAYIYDVKAAPAKKLAGWFASGHDAGTGPYTVDQWAKGQEVELRLKSYPQYWRGWKGAHYDRVVFRVVPSATTSAQLLRSGEVTWVERLNPQLWQTFQNGNGTKTTSTPSWQNLLGLLNTKSGPLANVNVRRAVLDAVDTKGMLAALKGAAFPQIGVIPKGMWGSVDRLPTQYSYNPAKAKQLLKQAGYGGGKKVNLLLTYVQGDSDEQLVSTLLKSNLAAVGKT
jgi:peptide/nickel transport system substrate-binding protein